MISALILDYGEVLVRAQSQASIERMAQLAGLEPNEFKTRYWKHRPDYDRGRLPAQEYWRLVVADAAEGTIAALKDADYESWIDYRDEVWDIAASFRQRGRTAILSNGVPEVMERVAADRPLLNWFDKVIVSYEVGCVKPDPEIYAIAIAAVGSPAAEALFVDDRPANIEAAQRAGLQTLHFTGEESVADLRSTLGLS